MKKLLKNKKILIIIIAVLALLVSGCVALFLFGNRNVDDVIDYLKRQVYSKKLEDLGDPNDDIGVRITDCDSIDAFKEVMNVKITNRPGKYVQGTGAFTNMKYQTDLVKGVLKQPIDISDYAEGSIHVSLYVEKKSALTDMLHFELSSMGAPDADELEWFIPLSKLEEGWNEYYLAIPGAFASGKLDLSSVNFLRLFSPNPRMGVNVALDDVYATETEGVIFEPESSALKPVTSDSYKETEAKDGKMIMSCNTVNIFELLGNVEVTNTPGEFVEGTGAFKTVGYQDSLGEGVFAKPVDISAYQKGYVHVSFYVNQVAKLKENIWFELTSSGTCDVDEFCWEISKAQLQDGWNELLLPFSYASAYGKPDASAINYFRFFTLKQAEDTMTIIDNVYATNVGQTDNYKETSTKNGKMIMSCNTVNIFSLLGNVKVTNAPGEFVEGTGAFKTIGHQDSLGEGVFIKPVDISAYQKGYIHVSFYVNQVSNLKDSVWLELTSSGVCDVDEYSWEISRTQLQDGWNDLLLPFSSVSTYGKPDASAINYFRFFTLKQAKGLVTIIDNVYATNAGKVDNYEETSAANGKMIMSCNTVNYFSVLENMVVTTEKNEFVEGTGALKVLDAKEAYLGRGAFVKPVDISAYKNGKIHLALYISDPKLLKEPMQFELSSSGTWDADEYEWSIPVSSLKAGWNDVILSISSASITGKPDVSCINYFRLYTLEQKAGLTIILDNVYAMKEEGTQNTPNENSGNTETTSPYGKMIMSCNTTTIFSTLENMTVTDKIGEYMEGNGALKVNNAQEAFLGRGVLAKAVDISEYEDKYIHLSLYINDISLINGDTVFELSSSGTWDKDEYSWVLSPSQLKSGWNELYLSLKTAIVEGTPDLKAINYFRLFTLEQKAGLSVILDNVYATKTDGIVTACGTKLNAGDVMKSNCLCYFSDYFNMKLISNCKEGSYALQSKNPLVGIYGTFKTKVNITAYKKGSIHIWIYVNDSSYLNNAMTFELSSSGTCNENEYEWTIRKNDLKTGWNELTLAFEDAYVTGKPDLANINYFRLFTTKADTKLKFALDDVYATLLK